MYEPMNYWNVSLADSLLVLSKLKLKLSPKYFPRTVYFEHPVPILIWWSIQSVFSNIFNFPFSNFKKATRRKIQRTEISTSPAKRFLQRRPARQAETVPCTFTLLSRYPPWESRLSRLALSNQHAVLSAWNAILSLDVYPSRSATPSFPLSLSLYAH